MTPDHLAPFLGFLVGRFSSINKSGSIQAGISVVVILGPEFYRAEEAWNQGCGDLLGCRRKRTHGLGELAICLVRNGYHVYQQFTGVQLAPMEVQHTECADLE